jgi:predicted metal-dependent phosphoesterase TrpH
MYKVDLHTHSTASPDGGITEVQYRKALESGLLDCIAVTDHNRIDYAQSLQASLGEQIIVGEEIMSSGGEIIGLFLTSVIPAGLTPQETITQIKDQGGLVYVPHPFETIRKGLHPGILDELVDHIDAIEVCNGRAFIQNRSEQAVVWARLNHVVPIASSDAHGFHGLGRTYMQMNRLPTHNDLLELCTTSIPRTEPPSVRALLYPKYHRLKRKLWRQA